MRPSASHNIPVQENRTGTINARLKPGSVSTTVDVTERPLLDTTDATNGTVFDNSQIESIPLATGSFTRAATLTPGVNSELLGGIGTNAGLGNPAPHLGQRPARHLERLRGQRRGRYQPVQRQELV